MATKEVKEKKVKKTHTMVIQERVKKAVDKYNKKLAALNVDKSEIDRLNQCLTILSK